MEENTILFTDIFSIRLFNDIYGIFYKDLNETLYQVERSTYYSKSLCKLTLFIMNEKIQNIEKKFSIEKNKTIQFLLKKKILKKKQNITNLIKCTYLDLNGIYFIKGL